MSPSTASLVSVFSGGVSPQAMKHALTTKAAVSIAVSERWVDVERKANLSGWEVGGRVQQ